MFSRACLPHLQLSQALGATLMPFLLSKAGGIAFLKTRAPKSHRGSEVHGRFISAAPQLQIASLLQHLPWIFSIASFTVLLAQPSAAVDMDGR